MNDPNQSLTRPNEAEAARIRGSAELAARLSSSNPERVDDRNPGSAKAVHLNPVLIDKAREIAEFCLLKGAKAFQGWPASILFSYVLFQVVDRSCYVVRAYGAVRAAMFLWGEPEATIRARDTAGEPAFHWTPSRPSDALLLAEVIADQSTLPKLFKHAASRWPDWQTKPIFTKRHGPNGSRLVQISHDVIKTLVFGSADKETPNGR